jgi:dethiobiotin synthase
MSSLGRTIAFVSTLPGEGKTTTTAAAAVALKGMGVAVGVMVPVAMGCRRAREGLVSADAELLAHFADAPENLATIAPYAQAGLDPPAVAVTAEPVDIERILECHARVARRSGVVLLEVHGGLLLPLGRGVDNASILEQMRARVVLVAPATARSFHSVLTTISCIRARSLELEAVVLNRYDPDKASRADEVSPDWIERFGGAPATYMLPVAKRFRAHPPRMDDDLLAAIGPLVRSWKKVSG